MEDALSDDDQASARGLWELAVEAGGVATAMTTIAAPGLLVTPLRPGPNVLIEKDEQVYIADTVSEDELLMLISPCPVRHAEGWWIASWLAQRGRPVRVKVNDWQPAW